MLLVVGWAAIVAPVLHCITDVMEWQQGGFSPAQLWLNYLAFLPVPRLLPGIYAACSKELGPSALVPAPDILQTVGTLIRNAGLVGMGYALLFGGPGRAA